VIEVSVERVAESRGYGVPLMSYEGEREHQALSSAKRVRVNGPDAYRDYQREKRPRASTGCRPSKPEQPPLPSRCAKWRLGEVAQLVEHTTENRGVAGSIPALAMRGSPDRE
jgi:hypothetical protein